MIKPLNVGVIGCGAIAPTHVAALQVLPDVKVLWACDLIKDRALALASRYDLPKVTTKYQEVLTDNEVDAVCICTDHASHAPIAVEALGHGKHVLCEKALAATTAGLDMMAAAHASCPDLVFGAVFQHRFDAEYQYLRELVGKGLFGQILTAGMQLRCLRTADYYRADQWRGTWAAEGGAVLINQAIHFIDALLWIMDGATELCGTYSNLTHTDSIEAEDTAAAILRFRNGAIGTLEATCSSHLAWEPTIAIHGTAGSMELRGITPIKISFEDPAINAEVETNFARLQQQKHNEATAGKVYYGDGHWAQLRDFIEAIREGRQPFVTVKSARRTVEAVLAVYESCHSRQWVSLPFSN